MEAGKLALLNCASYLVRKQAISACLPLCISLCERVLFLGHCRKQLHLDLSQTSGVAKAALWDFVRKRNLSWVSMLAQGCHSLTERHRATPSIPSLKFIVRRMTSEPRTTTRHVRSLPTPLSPSPVRREKAGMQTAPSVVFLLLEVASRSFLFVLSVVSVAFLRAYRCLSIPIQLPHLARGVRERKARTRKKIAIIVMRADVTATDAKSNLEFPRASRLRFLTRIGIHRLSRPYLEQSLDTILQYPVKSYIVKAHCGPSTPRETIM